MLLALIFACGEYVVLPEGETLDAGVGGVGEGADLASATQLQSFAFDGILRLGTVDGAGPYSGRGVDYDGLSASAEAEAALSGYLADVSTVNPSLLEGRNERFAFWLNLYNASVLWAVLGKVATNPDYGVESDGWLVFSSAFVTVNGVVMSPNDIEHGVLRGWADQPFASEDTRAAAEAWYAELWEGEPPDARLHVGLNCASASCPDVPPGALQGERLDEQLDALAVAFVNNEEKGTGPGGVSTLFSWFSSDFVGSHGSVEEFVEAYRSEGEVDYGTFLPYDWSLNRAAEPTEGAPCAQPW